jgi:hypothetical protein
MKVRDDFTLKQGFASNETTGVMDMAAIGSSAIGSSAIGAGEIMAALEDGVEARTKLGLYICFF